MAGLAGKQRGFIIRAEVEESPLTRVRSAQWQHPRLIMDTATHQGRAPSKNQHEPLRQPAIGRRWLPVSIS